MVAGYPSVVGAEAAPPDDAPPDDAGRALRSFCREFRDELLDIICTRLVQTNHVRRARGLRAALAMIAPALSGTIEVGASAGLLLNFDRYGYRLRRGHGEVWT